MMTMQEFEWELRRAYPDWTVEIRQYGIATWFDVRSNQDTGYVIEFVPGEGVGLSPLPPVGEMDFSGHDYVFVDFIEVVKHIAEDIASGR